MHFDGYHKLPLLHISFILTNFFTFTVNWQIFHLFLLWMPRIILRQECIYELS